MGKRKEGSRKDENKSKVKWNRKNKNGNECFRKRKHQELKVQLHNNIKMHKQN